MKLKTSLVFALIASTAASFGYTTTSTNYIGVSPSILAVVDNTGALIATDAGSVAVGYFGTLDDAAIGNAADFGALIADFVPFGAEQRFGVADVPGTGGLFAVSQDASIPFAGNDFTGKNIYTVMGDAGSLASSGFLAVWKSDTAFGKENELGLGSANSNVTGGEGSLVLGADSGALTLDGAAAGFGVTNGIQLVGPVPEPSSMLLLGLGGLGFLVRRKR